MRLLLALVLVVGCGSSGGSGGSGGGAGSGGSGGSGGSSGSGGTGGSGGSMADAGAYGPPGQLTCGYMNVTMTCPPGELCCAVFLPQTTVNCRTGSCMNGESTFACDGPEDCPGQKCCMNFNTIHASCLAQCDSAQNESQVCHTSSECPSSAGHCCTSNGAPSGICVATPPQGATCT